MPPKKAQPKKKATTHSEPPTAVGPRRSATKQKKAANRATAQPESFVHDDFDDYLAWVRRAQEGDQEVSWPTIRGDWEGVSEDFAAGFAGAVRAFRIAERPQTTVDAKLRDVLQRVLEYQNGATQRRRRQETREAEGLYNALVQALRSWQSATGTVLSRLDALDNALATTPQGGLRSLLETYQQGLRDQIEALDGRIGSQIKHLGKIPRDMWTPENVQMVKNLARDIGNDLSAAGPSSQPAVGGSSSSSSKRKRQGDAEERRPKAPRISQDPDEARSGSAKGGAATSQQRSIGPHATDQNTQQANGARSAKQDIAGPGLQPPPGEDAVRNQKPAPEGAPGPPNHAPQAPSGAPNTSIPEQTAPNALTGEPRATPQPLPFPKIGVAGVFTANLRGFMMSGRAPPSLIVWYRRQSIAADHHTLEDCEPLAEAVSALLNRVPNDHDWENESDMPPCPMNAQDLHNFQRAHVPNGRMWGNLRRLCRVVSTQVRPESFLRYFNRNFTNDGLLVADADSRAFKLLRLVIEKGLTHDWDNESDVALIAPHIQATKDLPLEKLNGHWNVSVLMPLW